MAALIERIDSAAKDEKPMNRTNSFPAITARPDEADLIGRLRADAEAAFAGYAAWARPALIANYIAIRISGERGDSK